MTTRNRHPEAVKKLWLLWNGLEYVISTETTKDASVYLSCFSEREARTAARQQEELFGVKCLPVMVIPEFCAGE